MSLEHHARLPLPHIHENRTGTFCSAFPDNHWALVSFTQFIMRLEELRPATSSIWPMENQEQLARTLDRLESDGKGGYLDGGIGDMGPMVFGRPARLGYSP